MISLANFSNSVQFTGDNADKSLDQENSGAEFSALLSAFCAAPQQPIALVCNANLSIAENTFGQFVAEIESAADNDSAAMTELGNAPANSLTNKKTAEINFAKVDSKEKLGAEFKIKETSSLVNQNAFSLDQNINQINAASIYSREKDQTEIKDFASKDKNAGDNLENSLRPADENAQINFVKIEKNNLPQPPSLPASSLPNFPIDFKFIAAEKPQKAVKSLAPLQKILQGIIQLPLENFVSSKINSKDLNWKNLSAENPGAENLGKTESLKNEFANFKFLNSDGLYETSNPKRLDKSNFSEVKTIKPIEKQNLKAQDAVYEKPVQSDLLTPNTSKQSVSQNLGLDQTVINPKSAIKIKENNLLETSVRNAAVSAQDFKAEFANEISKTVDLQAEINSLEQIKEAILEMSDKLNSIREPQLIKLRLRPAELGTVDIKLEQTATGKINARLITSSELTSQTFNENISQLREALTAAGWQVERIEISYDSSQITIGQNTTQSGNQEQQSSQALAEEQRSGFLNFNSSEEPVQLKTNLLVPERLLSVRA